MTVSIRDVARHAGVSATTVSRVINDSAPVAKDTRRRILEAIESLNYVPHGGARSLITRKTHTVGVLLPDLYGEFFSELIRGIDLTARRNRHHVLVSGSHSDPAELEAMLRALRGRVDGMIVMAPDVNAYPLLDRFGRAVPMVLLDSDPDASDLPAITIDNFGGARSMMRHLLALGHRRIALLGGPEHNRDARERARGWRESLAGTPLGAESAALVFAGDFSELSGYAAGARIAALQPLPDAVFAANDAMAVGCLSAFREHGLRVPEDIALAGFDDIPIARYMNPPLTSVRVSIADLGARAMTRLVSLMGTGSTAADWRRETLATELVVRASCGAPTQRFRNPTREERR
jgi:LacI family transcriptional regulator